MTDTEVPTIKLRCPRCGQILEPVLFILDDGNEELFEQFVADHRAVCEGKSC